MPDVFQECRDALSKFIDEPTEENFVTYQVKEFAANKYLMRNVKTIDGGKGIRIPIE